MKILSKNIGYNCKYRVLFLYLCFYMLPVVLHAQVDIHFSQFYETSILRNPALTGVFADDYKFGAYYRNQWSSISHPYQTELVSAEMRVPASKVNDDFFSFGILAYADKAGSIDQQIIAFYPAVNYNKSLNSDHNTYLSVGFTGGYLQYSFDPNKATFNNQFQNGHFNANNPSLENLPEPKLSILDAGAGVNFNTSAGENNAVTYMAGISGYHFNQPKITYYQVPGLTEDIRWNANLGMACNLPAKFSMMIQGNYARQGSYSETMLGGLVSWTARSADGVDEIVSFSAGVFYRFADAVIPVVKMKYKKMALGVSYDVNLSSLKVASNMQGAYEVTLFITATRPEFSGLTRKTICPRF